MQKIALCIGINDYPGTRLDLSGCVHDAQAWAAELGARGFSVSTLFDAQATKAAMVEGFRRTIGAAAKGDIVVITYSGHGTYVPDANGDEADGLDEALCPYDIQTGGGALIDDEIHDLFEARAAGVRLVLISDSCHSGTVTRAAFSDDTDLPRARFLPMENWMPRGMARPATPAPRGASPMSTAMADDLGDLLLAGCEEGPNHFSYDARIAGQATGAFTYYALKALKALPPGASYEQWHAAITPGLLPTPKYPQVPQIVGGTETRRRPVFE